MLMLPPPRTDRLLHSPLELVVCQVKFDEVVAVGDVRVGRDMHDALGGRKGPYPKLERFQIQTVTVPLGASLSTPAAVPQNGWRMLSEDGRWIVAVMPDHISLETTGYESWSDFQTRLWRLLDAAAEHIAPAIEQRIGLRYVDRIINPTVDTPSAWQEYIAPELLGAVLHETLGPAVSAAQQQLDLIANDDARCTLRHGFFPDPMRSNALTYLLDYDLYRQGLFYDFRVESIKEVLTQYHILALQLFQQTITPRLYRILKGEEEA